MRPAVKITLAVSSLLIISACGAQDAPTVTATQVASAPASASVTPSMVSSAPPQASPVVKKRIVTSRRAIPFKTMRVNETYAKLSLKKHMPMAARNEDKKVFNGLL